MALVVAIMRLCYISISIYLYLYIYIYLLPLCVYVLYIYIPACPGLVCFFNRGVTEGISSSENLCSMFVYVLFYVNLC